jgi:hypothetical protein
MKQNSSSVQQCLRCVLPSNFPGIRFNHEGICNYCLDFKGTETQQMKKTEFRQKFDALIKEYQGKSVYDCLMCHSGGKDSTYTLGILKEKYHLNILAVSFDNGFLPEQTLVNIRNSVDKLGIDHILIKPRFDLLARIFIYSAENDIYPIKALERSSSTCNSCMAIIKYSALRIAIEKQIPMIAYGWSPGQAPISSSVMKNMPGMIKKMQSTFYDPLYRIAGDEINPYFLEERHLNGDYRLPFNINPMAFLDYNIDEIYKNIKRFEWRKPEDVDANSTNCLLNSYANFMHKKHLGFHPYACELANLVREGLLNREEALQRLKAEEDPAVINLVKTKLEKASKRFYSFWL